MDAGRRAAAPQPGPSDARPLALVIEDDVDAAEIAQSMLKMCGFRVVVTGHAHEALHVISREKVGFVLLDICLPDMDGVAFLQVAAGLPGFRGVPVVAASALYPSSGPVGTRLRELGVKHYLDKPFSMSGMRTILGRLFPDRVTTAMPGRVTEADTEALALPVVVEVGGETRKARLAAADGRTLVLRDQKLPVGQPVTLRLTHKQLVFGEVTPIELVAMATVMQCVVGANGPICRLDVMFARPPLEWDNMTDELPKP